MARERGTTKASAVRASVAEWSCYIRRRAAVDGVFTHGVGWEDRPGDSAAVFARLVGSDFHHLAAFPAISQRVTAFHRGISKSEATR